MFCPRCGFEALESQKFCKNCGSNLGIVASALESGDDMLKQLGIDVEAIKREIVDFGKNVKSNFENLKASHAGPVNLGKERITRQINDIKKKAHEHARHGEAHTDRRLEEVYLKQRKKYLDRALHYSREHNLRDGLMSLFFGAGFGIFLYYLAQALINNGTLGDLQAYMPHPVRGVEEVARLIWLIAAIPVLKGLGQIIYGVFFAESAGKLAERFAPPMLPSPPAAVAFDAERETTAPIPEPPPSVTEHTTEFFEEAHPRMSREAQ